MIIARAQATFLCVNYLACWDVTVTGEGIFLWQVYRSRWQHKYHPRKPYNLTVYTEHARYNATALQKL